MISAFKTRLSFEKVRPITIYPEIAGFCQGECVYKIVEVSRRTAMATRTKKIAPEIDADLWDELTVTVVPALMVGPRCRTGAGFRYMSHSQVATGQGFS
jgi:hypothetical protein